MTAPLREPTLSDDHYMAILRRTEYQNTVALRRMADECFAAGLRAPAPTAAQPAEPPATDANLKVEQDRWRDAAFSVGEKFGKTGPEQYYSMTPDQWSKWMQRQVERQALEIAELKSERDAAQRAGVTTANYWMERAERAEAAFDTMRQSREAAVRLWNDCGEDSQHLVSRLTSITAAADGMRRGEDCPMCDSGKLRDPNKEHWDTCAFAAYDAARSKK